MKTDIQQGSLTSARPVRAAQTRSAPDSAPERPRHPSLIFDSLGTQGARSGAKFRRTERRIRMIDFVRRYLIMSTDQIEIAEFPESKHTGCQRELTYLVRFRGLDRFPRSSVNEPALYLLSRRSPLGNRLMRERYGEATSRSVRRIGALRHLLAINDVRVRLERSCRNLGWRLDPWNRSDELAALFAGSGLVPDAYFQIHRTVDGLERTAAFALELERAHKTTAVVDSKLARYGHWFYSGAYRTRAGTRSLRLLIVFAEDLGVPAQLRIARGVAAAERMGVTIARFASLSELKRCAPTGCLTQPVWRAPGRREPVALFEPNADPQLEP